MDLVGWLVAGTQSGRSTMQKNGFHRNPPYLARAWQLAAKMCVAKPHPSRGCRKHTTPVRYSSFHILWVIMLCFGGRGALAQELPASASLEELLRVFITQTASPSDSINRSAFRPRLAGALARTSPARFKGTGFYDARMTLDSLIHLPSGNGVIRVAAWVTVESWEGAENIYFTCVCDSLWKIERIARFPTLSQRRQIEESIRKFDVRSDYDRVLRDDLLRLLLPDHILAELLRDHLAAATTTGAESPPTTLRSPNPWSIEQLRHGEPGCPSGRTRRMVDESPGVSSQRGVFCAGRPAGV
ncbi:MAG: hypothetical protein DYG96_13765 [Chlorobi bacterium CHB2]|nr:hypothetical protein [Chlorobi bacterium CHB2]